METQTERRESGGGRFRPGTRLSRVRFGAFALVALAIVALNLALTPPEVLTAGITGWTQSFEPHQVHEMVITSVLVLGVIGPLLAALYHSRQRVSIVLAPAVAALVMAVLAFEAGSFLFPGFAVSAVLALLVLVLHPAGRDLLRFDRARSIDRRALGLFVVGAIPLLVYAGLEVGKQLARGDDHALFVHYGAMAIVAGLVVLLGALALLRERDWRFAAVGTGLLAAYLGVVSVAFPASESSLGVVGGLLLLGWTIAFVVSVGVSHRGGTAREDEPSANRDGRPA